jgi:type I restriction enzyme S subunit
MEVNESSTRYLSVVHRTELGELPADWSVVSLGMFEPFVTSGSRGWATYYSEIGSPFLRITNLSRSCIYPSLKDLRYVAVPLDNSEGVRTALKAGDVLISITADIGIIGFVTDEIYLPAYINQHIALVRLANEDVNSRYIAYFLGGAAAQRRFKSMTDAGAKAGMNLAGIREVLIAIPPTTDEQSAIADALTDADALIDSLEQMLAKKRQIKQGAMQELLTGKRRLSGFVQEWSAQLLRDIAEMKSGEAITSEQLSDMHPYPCFGGNGLRGYADSFTHDGQFALVGRQGALCGNVALAKGKFFASEHAVVVTPGASVDIVWLHYVLVRMNLNQYSESSAQPGLSVARLMQLNVLVPELSEQTAIAQVLSDIDAEITALESRLTKARAVKQAMGQALLTGRIRLPVDYQEPVTLVPAPKGMSVLASDPARVQEFIA